MIVLGRIDEDGRDCSRCGFYLPWSSFPNCATGPRGHNSRCRTCLHECYRKVNSHRPEFRACLINDSGRECVACRTYKSWDHFGKSTKNARGKYAKCLDCAKEERRAWNAANPERRARLKLRSQAVALGLDPDAIEAHFKNHNGLCDICGRSPSEVGSRKRLSIDHDHLTGEFRGLLCSPCNSGLGQFRDSPKILSAAIDYLIRTTDAKGI